MSEIRVDTISEKTSANGVAIDGLTIKDGGITATTGSIVFNEASADVDFRIEGTGDANAFFLDGAVDRIYLGHNANTNINGLDGRLQISGTDFDKSSATLIRYSADANPPSIGFAKSRNASIAGNTIVQDGDNLGRVRFAGADGGDFANVAGQIDCQVDGTPGVNDMPGRLVFSTGADGATSATERVRIHSGGVMSASQGIALGVGTANTASNVLDDYEEGTWTIILEDHSDRAFTAVSGHNTGTYIKVGGQVTVTGYFRSQAINSASGSCRVSGLPFNIANNNRNYSAMTIGYAAGLNIPANSNISGLGIINTADANLTLFKNAAGTSNLQASEITADGQFIFTMTYTVV